MRVVVTGAAGFVGRELTRQLLQKSDIALTLFDVDFPSGYLVNDARVDKICGQLQDAQVRGQLLSESFDALVHLAALPGGASEAAPDLSKAVNLDATLALFEEAAQAASCPRVVYASTIAVLGAPMPIPVVDDSPVVPHMTYGTHKAMIELALADLSRRGLVDAVTIRLPGIVARPAAASGMKSAFLSNIFHALNEGASFVSPVSTAATMWLMSVQQCARNVRHALTVDSTTMPMSRAVTLPVIRCTMADLAGEVATQTGRDLSSVSYQPDAALEADFGAQPAVHTEAAFNAGFDHDGDLAALVRRALEGIRMITNSP
jgi:nucleoside-diphosphate-sugar epimerase